jgi:hypothetical protein
MVTNDEIPGLLHRYFREIPEAGFSSLTAVRKKSLIVDNVYELVDKDTLNSVVVANPLLSYPANMQGQEVLDCDDYSLQLKASMNSLNRQRVLAGQATYPPAVGMVITQNHALNVIISRWGESGKRVFVIDTMLESPKLVSNKDECRTLLKLMPIKFVYF